MDDRSADRIELRDQIAQFPIENPLSLDEFLNPENEIIVDKDKDIFTSVVNHYTIARPGEEEESSEEEEEVKKIDTAETSRAIEIVKMWKLQKGDSQDPQVLDYDIRSLLFTRRRFIAYEFFKPK